MFGLIPREEKFFCMFKDMATNIVKGALIIKTMLDNFQHVKENMAMIKEIEHSCDLQTHDIIRKLNTSFITPFDREDIYSLATALDNIIDMINTASQHLVVYHIDDITPEAKELGLIIYKACQTIEKAVSTLEKDPKQISNFCVELNSLEDCADKIRADAVSKLFLEEKDPIYLIKWKDVYKVLELVTDKCEDAANILESIVVKNV